MSIQEKIKILADSAKYDVSCSSSGSNRKAVKGELGNASAPGICHSWSADGRCISLLKILLSNECVYDCAYCVNRRSNDLPRATFEPHELAKLTMDFYRRNYIEGLFISSAVLGSPNYTMERMLEVVRLLREEYYFNGYIHMKAIPGCDNDILDMAGRLVDRMSINLELPTEKSLKLLAPEKNQQSLMLPMKHVRNRIVTTRKMNQESRNKKLFIPAGQTTQLMIGASQDSDYTIVKLSEALYDKMVLKRVYYSSYVPIVQNNALLPQSVTAPLLREHRLYQADWLMRFYYFKADEILTEQSASLNPEIDPKCQWALRNMDLFPIEVNKAHYRELLRVPGIGILGAKRIVEARRHQQLDYEALKRLRIVLKRAKYFILCQGKFYGDLENPEDIYHFLTRIDPKSKNIDPLQMGFQQMYPTVFQEGNRW